MSHQFYYFRKAWLLGCLLFVCAVGVQAQAEDVAANLKPFGAEFFAAAKAPDVTAPVTVIPADYRLGPHDKLRIRYWTPSLPEVVMEGTIAENGTLTITDIGDISAAGLTLDEFRTRLGARLKEQLKKPSFAVDLVEVRTFSIFVIGAARYPGQYTLKATASMFDVVLAAGGAAEGGSLRRIALIRSGKQLSELDAYKFLLNGVQEKTVPLQDRDTIFFPQAGTRVSIAGEVARQGVYECLPETRVADALALAGGMKATAYTNLLRLQRVINGSRVERTLDAKAIQTDARHADNVLLQDGDLLVATRVPDTVRDRVNIQGAVEFAGDFALARVPTAKALLTAAKVKTGAYWERADIVRLQADGAPVVIPIPVRGLLDGTATDIPLQDQDQVIVYRADEKALPALASVEGAVGRAATYRITAKMHVSDLLFAAGGLQRDAATDVAHLYRQVAPNEVKLLRVSPAKALQNDPANNLELQADDRLVIYYLRDIAYTPEKVAVSGEVQKPGEYRVYQGLTLYDLILLAGGPTGQAGGSVEITAPPTGSAAKTLTLTEVMAGAHRDDPVTAGMAIALPSLVRDRVMIRGMVEAPGPSPLKNAPTAKSLLIAARVKPGAYWERADLMRTLSDGTVVILPLPLKALIEGKAPDVALQDQDELVVYESGEKAILPLVQVEGPVKHPASYQLTNGMKLTDLLFAAGGMLRDSAGGVAHLYRRTATGEVTITRLAPAKAAAGDAEQNIMLQDGDRVVLYPRSEVDPLPGKVNIVGEVRRPGEYPVYRGLTLFDLLMIAGGPTERAATTIEVALPKVDTDGKQHNEVSTFALDDAIKGTHRDDPLAAGMLVSVPREEDQTARTMTVELRGQFKRPGTYVLLYEGESLGSLIKRAGGLTEEGEPFGIALTRRRERLLSGATQEQINTVLQSMDKLLPPVNAGTPGTGNSTEVLDVQAPTVNPLASSSRMEKVLLVSPRRLVEMPVNNRISFKLEDRESYVARMNDVPLTNGDIIEVPRMSRVVQVLGAVQSPGPVNYEAGLSCRRYLDRAGGPAPDADLKRAVVIKLSGTVQPFEKTKQIGAGDVIVVASKYQIIQPSVKQDWGSMLLDLLGTALVIRSLK